MPAPARSYTVENHFTEKVEGVRYVAGIFAPNPTVTASDLER
jgi:hypothetical protein